MPMFDYRCKECNYEYEELVQSCEIPDEEIICPKCGKNQSEKLISAPSIASGSSASSAGFSSNACGAPSGFS